MPAAEQARRDGTPGVQPGRPRPTMHGVAGPGEGVGAEGRLDPGADGIEIDTDGRQRVPVEVAEQACPAAEADPADDVRLDVFRGDAPLTQDGAGGLAGGGHGEQEMFAADIAVTETSGVFLGVDDNGAGVLGEALEHHRRPTRRPYLRCTVCLVTPSRSAMSC